MDNLCLRFFDRGFPHDYLFCYLQKGHPGDCYFQPRDKKIEESNTPVEMDGTDW